MIVVISYIYNMEINTKEIIEHCTNVAYEHEHGVTHEPKEWIDFGCRYMLAYLLKYGYINIDDNGESNK